MSREAFHLLLERYLQNRCTDEEKEIIEKWYGMLDKHDMEDIAPTQINALEQKLWDRIHESAITEDETPVRKLKPQRQTSRTLITAVAAVIAGFVIITAYVFFRVDSKKPEFMVASIANNINSVSNNTAMPMVVNLEDGSSVTLQPKSLLKYPKHFSKTVREVTLEGEGFFEISKNPSKPFLVYNSNVITRVVGTSFIVKTNSTASETEVTVKTGKVIVSPNSGTLSFKIGDLLKSGKGVILTPNQKTVYSASENTFATTLVDKPLPIAKNNKQPIKESYSFNDSRVADVLNQLQKSYGIEFVVEDKELYNYTFTGDLSEQDLYSQLDFLCESIQATYQVKETKIIIKEKN
ncbi:FecR family protein [Pedobacter panaciterrae]|jgi:Fe2+-dicitrate sensor, membrane component|uniref:FecR family protein n=1 Tax=Pedobacter panaciterrae TaxID=363849 RepID=A0ABU8NL74_9SPHI|nr:FecR family protein [Pedobacter panaciterrae]NQX52604.1 FecR family protein [Pedobacter panaciterrae]